MIQEKLRENLDCTMCGFMHRNINAGYIELLFLFLLKTFTSVKLCYPRKRITEQLDSVGQKG